MAWTVPMTAVTDELLTADEYNVSVRDNFLETAPHLAKAPGSIWQVTDTNRMRERQVVSQFIAQADSIPTRQTKYVEVKQAGPMVTVVTGSSALVTISCEMTGTGDDHTQCSASFEVSGSTNIAASDDWRITHDAIAQNGFGRYSITRRVSLNPGSNTFRMKYRTGGLGPFTFKNREIVVIPL